MYWGCVEEDCWCIENLHWKEKWTRGGQRDKMRDATWQGSATYEDRVVVDDVECG